jgi:hypothetical protein
MGLITREHEWVLVTRSLKGSAASLGHAKHVLEHFGVLEDEARDAKQRIFHLMEQMVKRTDRIWLEIVHLKNEVIPVVVGVTRGHSDLLRETSDVGREQRGMDQGLRRMPRRNLASHLSERRSFTARARAFAGVRLQLGSMCRVIKYWLVYMKVFLSEDDPKLDRAKLEMGERKETQSDIRRREKRSTPASAEKQSHLHPNDPPSALDELDSLPVAQNTVSISPELLFTLLGRCLHCCLEILAQHSMDRGRAPRMSAVR